MGKRAASGRAMRVGAPRVVTIVLALLCATAAVAEDPPDYAVPSHLTTEALLLDVTRAGDRLVAVGEWGHVVLSDDGGKTWRQAQTVPTRLTLTEVAFADARQGWAVGHDAVVLHTSDGGETWEVQFSDAENEAILLSVWFENAKHGIAVGAFGLMLETRDGGKHWEQRPELEVEEETPHLNHIFAVPDGTLFVAAEFGSAFRSRDGGATWQHLQLPYEGSLWGGLPLDEGAVLIFGMRGNAFCSKDMGETWQKVDTGTDHSLQDATRLTDGRIVIVGLGGVVTISGDDGRSFRATVQKNRRGIASVAEGADGALLFFGEAGLKTRPRDGSGSEASPRN